MAHASKKIRVVLIGGSGYAGFEVIRLLLRHPAAELVGVYGPPNELGPMEQFYPLLSKQVTLSQELFEPAKVAAVQPDLAMLCVPHKVAMAYVPQLRKAGLKVKLDPDRLERLEHIILSHQGELEWGAAAMAATPEAVFVSMVDNLDARMGMVQQALRQAVEGQEFTERVPGLEAPLLTRPVEGT